MLCFFPVPSCTVLSSALFNRCEVVLLGGSRLDSAGAQWLVADDRTERLSKELAAMRKLGFAFRANQMQPWGPQEFPASKWQRYQVLNLKNRPEPTKR